MYRQEMLTAIVPIHNFRQRAIHLLELFKTCCEFPIFLILVLDTKSDKEYVDLIESLANYKQLRYCLIRGDFESPGLARNKGLELCESEYLVFWDSDDAVLPSVYLELVEILKQNGGNLGVADISVLDKRFGSKVTTHSILPGTSLLEQIAVFPAFTRLVFKRSLIEDTRFSDKSIGEDLNFVAEILIKNVAAWSLNKVAYVYNTGFSDQLTFHKNIAPDAIANLLFLKKNISKSDSENSIQYIFAIRQMLSYLKRIRSSNFREFATFTQLSYSIFRCNPTCFLKACYIVMRLRRPLFEK